KECFGARNHPENYREDRYHSDQNESSSEPEKSYADNRRRELEFEVENKVFLRIAPMKGVMRFEKKGKLSPRYIGPFEILDQVGQVAYRVALPPSLTGMHNVFHVSMLRKYISDPTHILDYEPLQIQEDLTYAEEPICIIERKAHVLRTWTIPMVKVLWNNHTANEASWELEEEMRVKHPGLFGDSFDNLQINSEYGISLRGEDVRPKPLRNPNQI
ncbi:uncharacterized protein LOC122312667, partial [Carya illinoinensis]|uniref:uncharacterized protein LOC122312667 n=1 Tax=Carya illinoinensis TaxID=32201 RepID=UPI001C71819D